jgi:hypothetical protein
LASAVSAQDKRSVTFVWKDLAGEYSGKLDISFQSTITLNDDGLAFGSVTYPILGDVPLPIPVRFAAVLLEGWNAQ